MATVVKSKEGEQVDVARSDRRRRESQSPFDPGYKLRRKAAISVLFKNTFSVRDIAELLNVNKSTIYRVLDQVDYIAVNYPSLSSGPDSLY